MSKILLYLGNLYFINGKTGVGAYQANIIWGIKRNYDIIVPDEYVAPLPSNAYPIKISKLKRKIISLTKRFLPIHVFFKGYDYVITGGFCFAKSKKTNQFIIVHDLMMFTEPNCYTLKQRLFARIEASSYKNAHKIIAVSQTTKQTLHDLFLIDFSKIIVCPNITNFYIQNIPEDYFLFIGDMRKNKNLDSLIKGFSIYLSKYNGLEKLVIAGNKKFEYLNLVNLVKMLGLEKKVVFTGYVSEEEKVKLYEHACGLAFVSDNEGFGIPLLEAGVNKIPSICSDIPVFHEVLNEKLAIFVNHREPESIAEGLYKSKLLKITEYNANHLKENYSKKVFDEIINEVIEQ